MSKLYHHDDSRVEAPNFQCNRVTWVTMAKEARVLWLVMVVEEASPGAAGAAHIAASKKDKP